MREMIKRKALQRERERERERLKFLIAAKFIQG
jgi:hypothetical protein